MIQVDIERLIDELITKNEAYGSYSKLLDTKASAIDDIEKWKQDVTDARLEFNRYHWSVITLSEVFRFTEEQRQALRIAARAVSKWQIRTDWNKIMSDSMKAQLRDFIFGKLET